MKKIYKNVTDNLRIRTLIDADYQSTHDDMMHTVLERIDQKKQGMTTPDELWLVEHNDVYTLGQAGKEEHILERGDTPIVKTDRGGQVTWHGKGQLVVYLLFDLNSLGWTVRNLVSHAEQSIEDVLNTALSSSTQGSLYYAKARKEAPGVYIYNKDDHMLGKIASLGFKIKHGFSYHGIAINLNCDLAVFNAINPCGYAGMQMLKLADFIDLKHYNPQIDDAKNDNKRKCEPIDDKPILPPCSSSRHSVAGSVTKLGITQLLVDNLEQRQSGNIELRADKADNET